MEHLNEKIRVLEENLAQRDAENAALKARIAALEATVDRLETTIERMRYAQWLRERRQLTNSIHGCGSVAMNM